MAKKIAVFCGAGAEMSYGLPSGGKFALDIFRESSNVDKQKFRKLREQVRVQSFYAANWLPDDFINKRVSSFGKSHYETLVKGSLENKGEKIIDYLNNFDEHIDKHINYFANKGINIDNKFKAITGVAVGEVLYSQTIKLSSKLSDNNELFASQYFSALLKILEVDGVEDDLRINVHKIVKAIIELLIGASGADLTRCLNEGLFAKSIDSINLFDDIGGVFSLDYKRVGTNGLEYIIDSKNIELIEDMSAKDAIIEFGKRILEDIFSQALDYQDLIDRNWRYVYSPKKNWAKFCRIVIFLNTVARYIKAIAKGHEQRCIDGPGYYHDIKAFGDELILHSAGTTNYNTFIEDVLEKKVYYLNGCISDMYDPYLNNMVSETDNGHITVPFLFTQSGTKPLTSVMMSKRYVKLYDEFNEADIICIIGYGFNIDDSHINGIFRALIEDERKEIVILHYSKNQISSTTSLKKEYQRKLRLNHTTGIRLMVVDDERKCLVSRLYWYEEIIKMYNLDE